MIDSFDYFDKIFCINLSTRKDRWDLCESQFNSFDIKNNLEKFDAVFCNYPYLNKKQNAQLGCFLSHYKVLKKAQSNNYKKILILEDDFIFNFNYKETLCSLNDCFEELPNDWDLFYLGVYFVKGYDYEAKINYSNNLFKLNTGFTTHAICYSRDGISKMLNCMNRFFNKNMLLSSTYESLDWFLVKEFLYQNNCYASKKFLCGQREGFSDIENKFIKYDNLFLKGYLDNQV